VSSLSPLSASGPRVDLQQLPQADVGTAGQRGTQSLNRDKAAAPRQTTSAGAAESASASSVVSLSSAALQASRAASPSAPAAATNPATAQAAPQADAVQPASASAIPSTNAATPATAPANEPRDNTATDNLTRRLDQGVKASPANQANASPETRTAEKANSTSEEALRHTQDDNRNAQKSAQTEFYRKTEQGTAGQSLLATA